MEFPVSAQLLDACVLAIVGQGETYGYEMTQRIKQAFEISESTLYPVLRRLQKDGHLRAYDQPFQGRNRRYYSITESGERQLEMYRGQWRVFSSTVSDILQRGMQP